MILTLEVGALGLEGGVGVGGVVEEVGVESLDGFLNVGLQVEFVEMTVGSLSYHSNHAISEVTGYPGGSGISHWRSIDLQGVVKLLEIVLAQNLEEDSLMVLSVRVKRFRLHLEGELDEVSQSLWRLGWRTYQLGLDLVVGNSIHVDGDGREGGLVGGGNKEFEIDGGGSDGSGYDNVLEACGLH